MPAPATEDPGLGQDKWGNLIVEEVYQNAAVDEMSAMGMSEDFVQSYDTQVNALGEPIPLAPPGSVTGGNSDYGPAITVKESTYAILGSTANMDWSEMCYAVLAETMKGFNQDMRYTQ